MKSYWETTGKMPALILVAKYLWRES